LTNGGNGVKSLYIAKNVSYFGSCFDHWVCGFKFPQLIYTVCCWFSFNCCC